MIHDMTACNRQRLIDQLLQLPRAELDTVLDAVAAHGRTEEAGINAALRNSECIDE